MNETKQGLFILLIAMLTMPGVVFAQTIPRPDGDGSDDGSGGRDSSTYQAPGPGGTDLMFNIGAVLDGVGSFHTDRGGADDDNEFERTFELSVGGAIDPYADMRATFATHGEESGAELDEAWVNLHNPWIESLTAVVGQEKLPFGYLNRFHIHDFPQVDIPAPFEQFIGTHNFQPNGARVEWAVPGMQNPSLTLTAGVFNAFNGEEGGHGHEEEGHGHGSTPGALFGEGDRPYMLRAETFWESDDGAHGLLSGASWLSSLDNDLVSTNVSNDEELDEAVESGKDLSEGILVLDAKYKYEWPFSYKTLTIAGEYYYHEGIEEVSETPFTLVENEFDGAYGWIQYDYDQNWSFGFRSGFSDEGLNRSSTETFRNNLLYTEYRPSEFSRLRLQARHNENPDNNPDDEIIIGLQGTWFLGWHPAHKF